MSAGQSLQVRVYESLDELEKLVPVWENLLTDFPLATTFSTWEWLAPWWRAFGEGLELMALGFFDAGEALVGLAPLALAEHRISPLLRLRMIRLMGDGSQDSDNLDLLVRPGYEEQFASALLDYLAARSRHWHACRFNTMPDHSPAGQALASELKRRGWTHFCYTRPWSVVNLPQNWDSYLEQLSSEDRNNLTRYRRRLERRYKVRFSKCAEGNELTDCLEKLFELHQRRWRALGKPGSFSSKARRQFYDELARLLLARERLEFWLLDLDGKVVAVQFGFRHRDTVFQLQEGFDPAHSSDRVGFVLRSHVLKQLVAEGVRQYDFLAGEDPSKARWGAVVGTYKDIHFAGPWSRGSLFLRLVHSAGESKEWLRAHLPQPAWLLLRVLKTRIKRVRRVKKP